MKHTKAKLPPHTPAANVAITNAVKTALTMLLYLVRDVATLDAD